MSSLYLGLLLFSAAVLLLEVGLTRLFAIGQWYHFAFLAVSLALLGFGGGGSLHLTLFSGKGKNGSRRGLLAGLSLFFAASCVLLLLAQHLLPLDLYILPWDRRQVLYLALEYLALLLPFLLAGLALSLLLESHPERPGPLYACNLAGSALGVLLAPPLLGLVGAGRLPLAAGLLAALAAILFLRPGRLLALFPVGLLVLFLLPSSRLRSSPCGWTPTRAWFSNCASPARTCAPPGKTPSAGWTSSPAAPTTPSPACRSCPPPPCPTNWPSWWTATTPPH